MRGHKVALSGSFAGNTERLLKSLKDEGILQFSLVGREISVQVDGESLDAITKRLKKLGVDNINILEWKKTGITPAGSGAGADDDEAVKVSLIPSTIGSDIQSLAILCELDVDEKLIGELSERVEDVLSDAGITDALYTLHLKKGNSRKDFLQSAEIATLNALFEAGGVTNIE